MSRRWQACILCSASIGLVALATSLIFISRAATESSPPQNNNPAQSRPAKKLRNLALQPEATAVGRRLGNRFKSANAPSVLAGTVTISGEQRPITIVRRQTDYGETVELHIPGRQFTWSESEGVKATRDSPTEAERLLVERLVFDSPDQFVLAQIRGASYQTIVSNLRPTDAPDDYTGPLWTMVRINDPQTGQSESPKSAWRIYYINSQSGLIDRVECDVDGQKVEASILQWTEQNGERIPSHIRWTTNGQTLMEYLLTAFSQAE